MSAIQSLKEEFLPSLIPWHSAFLQLSPPYYSQPVRHLWCTTEHFREHLHLIPKVRATLQSNALVWCGAREYASDRYFRNDQKAQSVLWIWVINREGGKTKKAAGGLWCLCNINTAGWNTFSLRKELWGHKTFLPLYENRRLPNIVHLETNLQFNADGQHDAAHLKTQVFSSSMKGEIIACSVVISREIKHLCQ